MTRAAARLVCATALMSACGASEMFTSADVIPSETFVRDRLASSQTDSLSYLLRAGATGYEAEIGVVFTNRSPATAFFRNCAGASSLHLEKLVNGEWTTVWVPIQAACLSPPITVQPTASYRMIVSIFSGYPGTNNVPKFTVADPSGVFRIVWDALFNGYNSSSLIYSSAMPLEMRASNAFVLTAQSR